PSVPFVSSCIYSTNEVSGCPTFSLRSLPQSNFSTPCFAGSFSHYQQYKFHLFSRKALALQLDVKFHHVPHVVMKVSLEHWSSEWKEFVVSVDEVHGLVATVNNNTIDSAICCTKASEIACSSFNENVDAFKMELYVYGEETWWTPYCEPKALPESQSYFSCNFTSFGILISLCISLVISLSLLVLVMYLTVDWHAARRWLLNKKSKCELTLRPTILRPNTRVAFYTNDI
ncbi:hypothetical protein FHG87_020757, partial [Trinorchestia longiramus]